MLLPLAQRCTDCIMLSGWGWMHGWPACGVGDDLQVTDCREETPKYPIFRNYIRQKQPVVGAVKGSFSGGTIQTFVNYMRDRINDPMLAKLTSHPYCLIPQFPDLTYPGMEVLADKGGQWSPQ